MIVIERIRSGRVERGLIVMIDEPQERLGTLNGWDVGGSNHEHVEKRQGGRKVLGEELEERKKNQSEEEGNLLGLSHVGTVEDRVGSIVVTYQVGVDASKNKIDNRRGRCTSLVLRKKAKEARRYPLVNTLVSLSEMHQVKVNKHIAPKMKEKRQSGGGEELFHPSFTTYLSSKDFLKCIRDASLFVF